MGTNYYFNKPNNDKEFDLDISSIQEVPSPKADIKRYGHNQDQPNKAN